MPTVAFYVPAAVWRRLQYLEGEASAKVVARAIAKQAIIDYASQESAPGGDAPSSPSGPTGALGLTAANVTGADHVL